MGHYVGIDVGENQIGLAISDTGKKIAFPLAVIKRVNKSYCFNKINKLLSDKDVDAFIVGLPVRSNGKYGKEVESIRNYVESLKNYFSYEVILWDERYTSVVAEKYLIQADMRRKERKEVIDEVAAQIILQSYLDYLHKK
jgi:putative Holliday junction resolvase